VEAGKARRVVEEHVRKTGLAVLHEVLGLLKKAVEQGDLYVNVDKIVEDAVWVKRSKGRGYTEYRVVLPYGEIHVTRYPDHVSATYEEPVVNIRQADYEWAVEVRRSKFG